MRNTNVLIWAFVLSLLIKLTFTVTLTSNAKEIITGRCYEYQNVMKRASNVDCNEAWQLFSEAAAKPSCTPVDPDYQPLLNHLKGPKIPPNKSMFWSGTKDIATMFAIESKGYYILEATFAGYVFNDISWCGGSAQSCDGFCKNPKLKTNSYSFWVQASSMYAEAAEGEVTVLLNGGMRNNRTAFFNQSTFAVYELPRLNPSRITLIKVILVFDLKNYLLKEQNETCTQGSILILKERVIAKNITFQCEEKSLDVILQLCFIASDDADKSICKQLMGESITLQYRNIVIVLSVSIVILCISIIVFVCRHCRSSDSSMALVRQV